MNLLVLSEVDVSFWAQEVRLAQRKVANRRWRVVAISLAMMIGVWSLVGPASLSSLRSWLTPPSQSQHNTDLD